MVMRRSVGAGSTGVTLVELLVVVSVISSLAAILLPVFAQAREKARQGTCLSNNRQLGMAIAQYAADYDEHFPAGVGQTDRERVWAGEGWAGQSAAYRRDPGVLRCPSDTQAPGGAHDYVVSYAYNINLIATPEDEDEEYAAPPSGVSSASLNSPAASVLLFEVTGVLANVMDPREGAEPGGPHGRNYSASGNGLDHRLYAQRDWSTRLENQYATGYLGRRLPPDPSATQFGSPKGRHADGANFMLCDGHARWLQGARVSSGLNASASGCLQDNQPSLPGCEGPFHAAGTEAPGPTATFSIR